MMGTEDKTKVVYLITTKYSNNKLFESEKCTYSPDTSFLKKILLLERGFFHSLWSFVSINNKLDDESPLVEYVKKRLKTMELSDMSEWWSYHKSEIDTMNEIVDMALGLDSDLSDSEKARYKQLLTGFIRIELNDAILLITHNWYNSGIFSSLNWENATKYIFLENLIEIAAKKEKVESSALKLFLHDKDVIESGDKDEPLRNNIPDEYWQCPNLRDAITKGNVRVFRHDSHMTQPSFFKNVLNQGAPICKSVLEGYFNDRIPPKISVIPGEYIIIDNRKNGETEKYLCSTTEIINAIIELQLGNKFKLNAVELNDEYKDELEKISNDLPILVIGDKSLENLQSEDGRALYLDSSIWIRYAQKEGVIESIKAFFADCRKKDNIYKTANAKEVREFRARLAKNSFLRPFDGGHYGDVTPFVFHSETEMSEFIYKNRKNSNKEIIDNSSLKARISEYANNTVGSKLDWRILIVDDNAYQDNNSVDHGKVNKCNTIACVLKDDFYLKCENSESNSPKCVHCKDWIEELNKMPKNGKQYRLTINLECATDTKEAIVKLKKRRFDLILLDYLLGKNKDKSSRDFGTDLLRNLKSQYEDNILIKSRLSSDNLQDLEGYIKAKGPFGKFWIFFISAFSNAISEKMLSDGMHYNTEYWNVARGACPTTTPELFRYNLLSLMERQLKYITEVEEDDEKLKITTLIDCLTYLFDDLGDVRIRAIDNFNSLLHLRSRYDRLKNDFYMGGKELGKIAKDNGSPLVQALFPDMDCYSNAFWEHIQHLVYLIAFGNILQWNEMWDEYIFIKENLKSAEKATNKQNEKLHEKIEKYIIGIKSANFK